jgi:hypothetical protein
MSTAEVRLGSCGGGGLEGDGEGAEGSRRRLWREKRNPR